MGLLRYSFRSEALGYHVNVSIFYPSSAFTYMSDEEMEKVNPHLKGMRAPYRADSAFQCLYLMGDGRLRHTHLLCGTCKAQRIGYGQKALNLKCVHSPPPSKEMTALSNIT